MNHSNRLPGLEPQINDDQIKKLIVGSFPVTWQHAYIQSGQRIQTETLMKVVQYMRDEKSFRDNNHNKRKHSDNDNQGNLNRTDRGMRSTMRGGQRGGRDGGRNGYRSNPCRTHNGTHDRYGCWDNERGPNYRPERRAGRGRRGRQSYGRGGRSFGRGNIHQNGRTNYQQNYQNNNRGPMQQSQDQYHAEPHQIPVSNSTVGGTTLSSNNYPARVAPSTGYAGDLRHFNLAQGKYGSAWSTGMPHNMNHCGWRY